MQGDIYFLDKAFEIKFKINTVRQICCMDYYEPESNHNKTTKKTPEFLAVYLTIINFRPLRDHSHL